MIKCNEYGSSFIIFSDLQKEIHQQRTVKKTRKCSFRNKTISVPVMREMLQSTQHIDGINLTNYRFSLIYLDQQNNDCISCFFSAFLNRFRSIRKRIEDQASNAKHAHNFLRPHMLWRSMKRLTLMRIHRMTVKKIAKTVKPAKKAVKASHKN